MTRLAGLILTALLTSASFSPAFSASRTTIVGGSGGGPFESSTVLAYYMYDQAIKYYRIGYSAAIAVVLFAIMMVYIVYHLRRMLRTEQ